MNWALVMVLVLSAGTVAMMVVLGLVFRWNIMSNLLIWSWAVLIFIGGMGIAFVVAPPLAELGGSDAYFIALGGGLLGTAMTIGALWLLTEIERRAALKRLRYGWSLPPGMPPENIREWAERRGLWRGDT